MHLGAIFGWLGLTWGLPWGHVGATIASRGYLVIPWGHLEVFFDCLGLSWGYLEGILGLPGAISRLCRAILGLPWDHVGARMGHFGAIFAMQ